MRTLSDSDTDIVCGGSTVRIASMDMDSFDLMRCSYLSIDGPCDIAQRRLPLPEKFPTQTINPGDRNAKCLKSEYISNYKEQSHKIIGAMISREENACWSGTDDQRHNSVQTTAALIIRNKCC